MPEARYDAVADWYEETFLTTALARDIARWADGLVERLLGPGPGRCLDLGCGTGIHVPPLKSLDWSVAGIDLSAEQLRHAGRRTPRLARADAGALPFADASFNAVATIMTATDLDDLTAVLQEVQRVLVLGGVLVLVVAHPCFGGPYIERDEGGAVTVHPGYRKRGWVTDSPYFGDGIRPRVGAVSLPLPALLNPVLDAGLVLERIEEDDGEPVPHLVGLRARKP